MECCQLHRTPRAFWRACTRKQTHPREFLCNVMLLGSVFFFCLFLQRIELPLLRSVLIVTLFKIDAFNLSTRLRLHSKNILFPYTTWLLCLFCSTHSWTYHLIIFCVKVNMHLLVCFCWSFFVAWKRHFTGSSRPFSIPCVEFKPVKKSALFFPLCR